MWQRVYSFSCRTGREQRILFFSQITPCCLTHGSMFLLETKSFTVTRKQILWMLSQTCLQGRAVLAFHSRCHPSNSFHRFLPAHQGILPSLHGSLNCPAASLCSLPVLGSLLCLAASPRLALVHRWVDSQHHRRSRRLFIIIRCEP